MANLEIIGLFAILICVLLMMAVRIWPRKPRVGVCAYCGYSKKGVSSRICPECGRQHAPERGGASAAMRRCALYRTAVIFVGAGIASIVMWETPQMFPQQLSTYQHLLITGQTGNVTVTGRTRGWVGPFAGSEIPEPETIEFGANLNRFDIQRASVSAAWTDSKGAPVDADDVIARLGVGAEHKSLIDVVMSENWSESGLQQRAQTSWSKAIAPATRQGAIALIANSGPGRYSQEPAIIGIMLIWLLAGFLVVTGLWRDRRKFMRRVPAATLPA